MDFGRNGDEFWHTWWPRGPEGLNTPEFKEELGQVVAQLRRGVLKDFSSMLRHCHISGGEISGGIYQAYLTAYDLRTQELNQVQEQGAELDSGPVMGSIG